MICLLALRRDVLSTTNPLADSRCLFLFNVRLTASTWSAVRRVTLYPVSVA